LRVEFEIPERCGCGFTNFKIHGERVGGRLHFSVRCIRCGKPVDMLREPCWCSGNAGVAYHVLGDEE